jgi:hypothetical protein
MIGTYQNEVVDGGIFRDSEFSVAELCPLDSNGTVNAGMLLNIVAPLYQANDTMCIGIETIGETRSCAVTMLAQPCARMILA